MDHIKELEGKKILLLSGGWSAEREVSIRSGAAVSEALDRLSLEYTHLDLTSEEILLSMMSFFFLIKIYTEFTFI